MPRITRAAQRTNAILEDEANIAAATPLPSTPTTATARAPLGEIAANSNGDAILASSIEIELKPAKKGTAKAKKAKGAKKGAKKNKEAEKENVEVLEDDSQSTTSSAVEEACEDLMRSHPRDIHQVPLHDSRPQTPRSKAVYLAVKKISPKKPQTPRFDPNIHKMPEVNQTPTRKEDDSFVCAISSRTPGKMIIHEDKEESANEKDNMATLDVPSLSDMPKEDSFAEYIIARSPIKASGRIEDSVEEIDALEEAIEQIGESIPVIVDEPQSPVKTTFALDLTKHDAVDAKLVDEKPSTTEVESNEKADAFESKAPTKVGTKAKTKKVTAAKKPTTVIGKKEPVGRAPTKMPTTSTPRKVTPTRPSAAKPATTTVKVALPGTQPVSKTSSATSPPKPSTGPARSAQRRVSSITKAPFVPQRSTKPPTRSTFTLPGESISQKLKAQREERLKQQEEEESKRRVFKARPVPASVKRAPVVKATATSKARISIAKGELPSVVAPITSKTESEKGTVQAAVRKTTPRISSVSSTVANVHSSTHPIKKRLSVAPEQGKVKANTSTPRSQAPAMPVQNTVTPARLAVQRTRGKEVFGRERVDLAAKDQDRRQKEEAAKRARAEAAEKGRQASREWAEKMKARKASAANATASAAAVSVVAASV